MGYMGFGMRKEDYKRKPKKVFKRARATSIPVPSDGSKAGHDASKAYQKLRFRPIRERRWFKFLTAVMIIFICGSVLNVTVFDQLRYLKTKHDFEKAGAPGFYSDHQSSLDSLITFLSDQNGKVTYVDGHKISLRSKDYEQYRKGRSEKAHHRGLDYFGRTVKMQIVEGNLKFPLHDFYRTHKEYWSCDVLVSEIKDLDPAFFKHLETSPSALKDVLEIAAASGLRASYYEHGLVLSFDRFDHTYNLIHSDSISYFQATAPDSIQPISKNLFWVETRLYTDLEETSSD